MRSIPKVVIYFTDHGRSHAWRVLALDTLGPERFNKEPEWADEVWFVPDDREGCADGSDLLDGYFFGRL